MHSRPGCVDGRQAHLKVVRLNEYLSDMTHAGEYTQQSHDPITGQYGMRTLQKVGGAERKAVKLWCKLVFRCLIPTAFRNKS